MDEIRRIDFIQPGPVRSLAWVGDEVCDLAAGGTRFRLDGTLERATFFWGFDFDTAVSGPAGIAAVLKRRGTKALVWSGPDQVRQLNRDYYFADAFDYPLALFTGPQGQPLLAHCPDSYRTLQLEEAGSGRRLTARRTKSPDFFHSRLAASPSGHWLASAGWAWHPFETVLLFEVGPALADPRRLDRTVRPPLEGEVAGIAWTVENHLLISSLEEPTADDPAGGYQPIFKIGCFDPDSGQWCYRTDLPKVAGELLDLGDHRHVVAFDGYPRLLDARSGLALRTWPELPTGARASCLFDRDRQPLALDQGRARFAVANDSTVTIIELG